MSGKQWTIFGILMAVALGLAGLGFAAMSTNPPFAVASWVPIVFFVAAGMIFAYSLSFFTHNMIYNTKREKEARRQPNDGTVLLRLLDETHQKIHLVAENTINRLRDNGWQGMDKVFEDMTGINPNEVAIALQYWALKGVAQFMSGSEITIEKDVSELAEYIKKEVGTKKTPEMLAADLSLSVRHRFLDQSLRQDRVYNNLQRLLRRERDKYPDEAISNTIESYLDHSFMVNAVWVITEYNLVGIPSLEQTFEYKILPGHILLRIEDVPNLAMVEMERFRNKVAVTIHAYLKEQAGRIVHRK